MLPTDRALLTRIETLAIDPPDASLTFVDRLARDNGWSQKHAAAVDREYRRFLFLAATADEPVTPSDAVDQAWHLHLAYSRSYWIDLCGGIIGRPLHHGPTAGGAEEDSRYAAQYAATLARYARVFEEDPPFTIWPAVDQRFADRFVRVPVEPPSRYTSRHLAGGAVAVLAVGLTIVALTGSISSGLLVMGAVLLGLILAALSTGAQSRQRKRGSDGSGCGTGFDGGGDSSDGGHGCGSGCGGGGCGGD